MNNYKNQKGAIPIIVVIILVIAIGGAAFKGQQYLKKDRSSTQVVPQDVDVIEQTGETMEVDKLEKSAEPLEINFSTGGMIFDENRKTGVKEWTFLYDEPGRLAIDVKLVFNKNSICDLGEGEKVCDMSTFVWEEYSEDIYFDLDGNKKGNEVTVIKLKLHRY